MPSAKPHLANLERTTPSSKTRREYLRLDMNENIINLPSEFVKGVLEKVSPDFLSMYPEYSKLESKLAQINNVNNQCILLSNGADGAIKYIFDAYVEKDDNVLLTDPTFAMYPVYCKMFDANAVSLSYYPDLSFPVNLFLSALENNVKVAVIINPNNPTGSVIDPEQLEFIIKVACEKDVLLVVDEAYFHFYPNTVLSMVEKYKNLIVLRTFSKFGAIASLRLGYLVACKEIIQNIRKVKPTFDVNGLAVIFAQQILDSCIVQDMLEQVNEGKRYLREKLTNYKLGYQEGHGNFILIDCADKATKVIKLLKQQGILVGGPFAHEILKNYIRITIGDKKSMEYFWTKFQKVLDGDGLYHV